MTKEKELLLQDLSARLPYGVKVKFNNINILSLGTHTRVGEYVTDVIEPCQPYLFPLSSMTVEQRCKVQNLLPDNCDISFKNQKITFYDEGGSIQLDKLEKLFNFFDLWHIDYRGLIQMGLAIDATDKNIY